MNVWNFNEALTNDVISFEQPDPGVIICSLHEHANTEMQVCLDEMIYAACKICHTCRLNLWKLITQEILVNHCKTNPLHLC